MTIQKLRLATETTEKDGVHEAPVAPEPLRFERRTMDRWPVQSAATAFRLGGERFGEMHELKVVDFSWGGCGAISGSPIEPGAAISIGFSAPGQIARRGVVVHCTPRGDGYRLAIQFEARMAA